MTSNTRTYLEVTVICEQLESLGRYSEARTFQTQTGDRWHSDNCKSYGKFLAVDSNGLMPFQQFLIIVMMMKNMRFWLWCMYTS